MRIYASQKLPGVATNNLYLEHWLNGLFTGRRTRCYHYDLPDEEAEYWIRTGMAKKLVHRFDCVQSAPKHGQTDRAVY